VSAVDPGLIVAVVRGRGRGGGGARGGGCRGRAGDGRRVVYEGGGLVDVRRGVVLGGGLVGVGGAGVQDVRCPGGPSICVQRTYWGVLINGGLGSGILLRVELCH
jgi:hypothetical protein